MNEPEKFGIGRLFWLVHEAIVAADVSTERICLWNPSAERLFGYTTEEAINMPLSNLVPEELSAEHHAGIRRYRETRKAKLVGGHPVEVPAVTKEGGRVQIALSLNDLPGSEEGPFVLAVIRDITRQKAAEDELHRVNEAMRSFVATASHDLRTPLTTMLGFARLLVERGESLSAGEIKEFSEAILRGSSNASRLVDDLLTVSKVEAGAIETRREAARLHPLIQQALGEIGSDAAIDCPDDLQAMVDPDHLLRILQNLASNAARYGVPPVTVRAGATGSWVEISVCDSGDGVLPAFETRLFTSFARAEGSGRQDGTGLGLSIVKGLAEANGGTAFYRKIEDGACFGVQLEGIS